jgi:hypothetical protein
MRQCRWCVSSYRSIDGTLWLDDVKEKHVLASQKHKAGLEVGAVFLGRTRVPNVGHRLPRQKL